MTSSNVFRIQADAIIVSSQQLIAPGQLVIRLGQIVEATADLSQPPDARLDNCVLLPGLVNSHTHLEFSDLVQPLPPGNTFPDWIRNVLARRQQIQPNDSSQRHAIRAGLDESRAAGVVAVGDIVTAPWQLPILDIPLTKAPQETDPILTQEQRELIKPHLASGLPKVIAFIEQLGLTPERRAQQEDWRSRLLSASRTTWPDRLLELALSPHAPYSTPLELCAELTQLAAHRKSLVAMHLLESPAEREWIDKGTGPMADMLAQFGAAGWRLPNDYIAQLCRNLSKAKSALLVHGNYLTETDLDCVARHRNLSIVYCPRTHAHFQHRTYRLAAIEQRGIRWSLGTDSRSTNPDLNLWQEALQAAKLHKDVRPSRLLGAITDAPATALNIADRFGSLTPGRAAAINYIRLASTIPHELEALIETLLHTVEHPKSLTP